VIQAALVGRVLDAATSHAIKEATITLPDGTSVESDAEGMFTVSEGLPMGARVVLRVSHPDYATNVLSVMVGKETTADLGLVPFSAHATIDSTKGGSVSDATGAKVTFPAGIFVKHDGTAVKGSVMVSIAPIDPTQPGMLRAFPGEFTGKRKDGSEVMIETAGPMLIEARLDNELLTFAKGMKAEIAFPLAETLTDSAPDTIVLWSLDEETGLWIEEGVAMLDYESTSPSGRVYRSAIGHLSAWNPDAPTDSGCLRGRFVYSMGRNGSEVPLAYAPVYAEETGDR
jgi:hypothetical protein